MMMITSKPLRLCAFKMCSTPRSKAGILDGRLYWRRNSYLDLRWFTMTRSISNSWHRPIKRYKLSSTTVKQGKHRNYWASSFNLLWDTSTSLIQKESLWRVNETKDLSDWRFKRIESSRRILFEYRKLSKLTCPIHGEPALLVVES